VTVKILDGLGNLVTSATNSVTMALANNPTGTTIGGALTVAAVAGVATFSDLSIDTVATGYTIEATSGSLTAATSAAFNITPAAAAQLFITVQPTETVVNATITPAVAVVIQDEFGNTVTGATDDVTIAITVGTGTGGAVLSGDLTVPAVAGVATFLDLSIDLAGTDYSLTVTATGLTDGISDLFNITAGT
jgi:hypothetical protein